MLLVFLIVPFLIMFNLCFQASCVFSVNVAAVHTSDRIPLLDVLALIKVREQRIHLSHRPSLCLIRSFSRVLGLSLLSKYFFNYKILPLIFLGNS